MSDPFDPREPGEPRDRSGDDWSWPERDLRDPDRYADDEPIEDEPVRREPTPYEPIRREPGEEEWSGYEPVERGPAADEETYPASPEPPPQEPSWQQAPSEPEPSAPPRVEPGEPRAQPSWSGEPAAAEPASEPGPSWGAQASRAPEPEERGDDLAAAQAGGVPPPPPPPVDTGDVQTGWNPKRDGERRRPTTAEQAVPWLIGLILALSGIIIVLVVLIYSDYNGAFAGGSPSPTALAFDSPTPLPSSSGAIVNPSASASASPTATPTPGPTYGAQEMLYLSRPATTGTSQLFRDDFATNAAATSVLKGGSDVQHYALAPDGTVGVAILGGALDTVQTGKPTRKLASDVSAATFGEDASTVYAVEIVRHGVTDDAVVTAYTFADGKSKAVTTITHPHPVTPSASALVGAQAFDDGGSVRLYATTDGNLVLWIQGAGQWRIDPVSGNEVAISQPPILWSPDGTKRIAITQSGNQTTLSVVDATGKPSSSVFVSGLISHLRWSPGGNSVVFTAGRAVNGGVVQDIYLWDLVDKKTPRPLSTNGATWGAEFLGARESWTVP
jgi:hypothetical protein